jgi:hypothetical protein
MPRIATVPRHGIASRTRGRVPRPVARFVLAAAVIATIAQTGSAAAARRAPAGATLAGRAGAQGMPRQIVAVTTRGALVVLAMPGGSLMRTLVGSGVLGDALAVSPDGRTVYLAVSSGCYGEIEAVPITGGRVDPIAAGTYPALSPDGARLAFAHQLPIESPTLFARCSPHSGNPATLFSLVIRNLASGSDRSYPVSPAIGSSGLPTPISHLSWAADGNRLLVSSPAVEDNEGWKLVAVDTASARYWFSPSTTLVPVAGSSAGWYVPEAVFEPDGNLFAVRECCAGIEHGLSPSEVRLDQVSSTTGAVLGQVAIGFADRTHTSLDVDPSGRFLLYLSGDELFVSAGGAVPTEQATGLAAAAWAG